LTPARALTYTPAPMASNTKATELRRKNKQTKVGRKARKAVARKGTTRTETQLFGNTLARGT
jgi:hypothetical protein